MRKIRRLIASAVTLGALSCASPALAAYPTVPASQPAHSCTTTASTVSAWQTNVNTAASGTFQCLAAGTYSGLVTFNRTAAGTVTASSVSGTGVVLTGGVALNGGSVTMRGLDISNATNATNLGDCFREAAGITAAAKLSYSLVHNCYRNGVVQVRPACTAPCTPASGYSANFTLDQSKVYDVGNTDTTGTAVIIRGDSNTVYSNEIGSDTAGLTLPNDAILAWGNANTVLQNKVHGLVPAAGNHPDVIQTFNNPGGDGAQGLPLTNLVVERNRAWNNSAADGHFIIGTGLGHSTWSIRTNEVTNMGGIDVILGTASPAGAVDKVTIGNNVFNGTGDTTNPIISTVGTPGTTTIVASNAFYNAGGGTSPYSGTYTHDYNSYYGGTSSAEAHAVTVMPMFVDATNRDYHTQSTSPLREAGDNAALLPILGLNIDAGARKIGVANDIGSDEH